MLIENANRFPYDSKEWCTLRVEKYELSKINLFLKIKAFKNPSDPNDQNV